MKLINDSIGAQTGRWPWKILDGGGVFLRGEAQFSTAPCIESGRAVSLLLEGTLPTAPTGSWWFYGVPDGVTTIKKKVD
jgi:hypothetical protein